MWARLSLLSAICATTACSTLHVTQDKIQELPPTATGGDASIVSETWHGIGGRSIRSLTRHYRFPGDVSEQISIPAIDLQDSLSNKFGRRIRAILKVDETGPYRFRISADDSAEFWLATDAQPVNKRLLAFTNRPTGYKVWDRYNSQRSREVELTADTPYFLEVLHKEKDGEDYLVIEMAHGDNEYSVLSQNSLHAYTPGGYSEPDQDIGLPDVQQVHETAYHAGYSAGFYSLAYDASYPLSDQDQDGVPDFFEAYVGTDPNDLSDALDDMDGDALTNYEEYVFVSNPTDADSDGDSISDGYEVAFGMNYLDASDADADMDNDGFSNLEEYLANTSPTDSADIPEEIEKEVMLSWIAPTQNEDGSDLQLNNIERYKIYSGTSASELTELTSVTDSSQLSLTLTLGEGTYFYAVSAVAYEDGEGPKSDVISVTIN